MKGVLGWAKTNWLIVVLVAVPLIAVPVLVYFSSSMGKKFTAQVQAEVTTAYKGVADPQQSYAIPGLKPGTQLYERREALNRQLIERYAAIWASMSEEASGVLDKALAFNQSDHGLLVEGLFPEPERLNKELKPREMAKKYIAAHAALLETYGAGGPPETERLAAELRDMQERERSRLTSQAGTNDLSDEELAKLTEELRRLRISRYLRRAGEIEFYADGSVFPEVPVVEPTAPPPLTACWDWQERYWIHDDLMRAIRAANETGRTQPGVPGSVVKRVLSVRVTPAAYSGGDAESPSRPTPGMEVPGGVPFGGGEAAVVEKNYGVSLTGRVSGKGTNNGFFDVRDVAVEMIVSTERLPAFFDALTQTNLMTVTQIQLERFDPMEDLRMGYAYGDEPAVRATMTIETLWLRAWRVPYMPKPVKDMLGIAEPPPQ